jgi:TRAP-type C4-dicarboxylate transport system permease small subunit
MSALNLHSTTGIIYIVLIIVACLFGLYVLRRVWKTYGHVPEKQRRQNASQLVYPDGGRRRKHKRPRK